MNRYFGPYFDTDRLYQELYSKHFKKYYAGKPTKRYLRIMSQLQKVEQISTQEIEKLFVS